MRILHTAQSYAPEVSGVAGVVGQISERLAHRGHEVHVATGRPHLALKEEARKGVRLHRFPVETYAVTRIRGDVDSYLRFVQSTSWDVIVTHRAQSWTTDAILPHLHHMSTGTVFVGHGLSALHNPQYQGYFIELARHLRQVDKTVALSDLLEEVPFFAKHRLTKPQIIPNGVDLTEWDKPAAGLRQRWRIGKRPWVLSVSNHSTVKNHAVFFEVVQRLHQQMPSLVGTIVGGNYPAAKWGLGHIGIKGGCWYRCRLTARTTSDVILRWDVPREDVVSAVQEADVILVTSSYEASPLVVLEAMAAGTPWISFDVGCVREHAGGVVVGSPGEMVTTACQLLKSPEQREKLGQAGKIRVAEKHDWEKIAVQYEHLYESVVKNRGK